MTKTSQEMTLEDLYETYAHLQGQLAATTNLAATLAALHPDKKTIGRVIEATAASKGYERWGGTSTAEKVYAESVAFAVRVFRAARAELNNSA